MGGGLNSQENNPMKYFVVEPGGYLNDKLWKDGEVIVSEKRLPPATWYHAEGQEPLQKAKINESQILMNKPSDAGASAQDVKALQADVAKLQEKDKEIAELKAKLGESYKKLDEAQDDLAAALTEADNKKK